MRSGFLRLEAIGAATAGGKRRSVTALRLSDELRERLHALLANDRCDGDRLMTRLRELRDSEGRLWARVRAGDIISCDLCHSLEDSLED